MINPHAHGAIKRAREHLQRALSDVNTYKWGLCLDLVNKERVEKLYESLQQTYSEFVGFLATIEVEEEGER